MDLNRLTLSDDRAELWSVDRRIVEEGRSS
jgi:hypothetical protein